MEKDQFAIDFLTNRKNLYLADSHRVAFQQVTHILPKDFCLYHIEEISFEDQAPRKEALENVLSAMKIEGINFIYLILGDTTGVHFYYGLAKDLSHSTQMDLSVQDIGEYILEPSIRGNFRGSKLKATRPLEKSQIMKTIEAMPYTSLIEGVPGIKKDGEKFQGVDRLVDVMLGDTFSYMIIAKPLNHKDTKEIESHLHALYSRMLPLSKKSQQESKSKNTGTSTSTSKGTTEGKGENYSKSSQDSISISNGTNNSTSTGSSRGTSTGSSSGGSSSSTNKGANEGTNKSTTNGTTYSESKTTGGSTSQGTNTSFSTSNNVTEGTNTGKGQSESVTLEFVDKKAQDWIKYIDEVIIPRLDYGMGKGVFVTSAFLCSNNKASLKKLENTVISLYSGNAGNKVPLKATRLTGEEDVRLGLLKNFQVPFGQITSNMESSELIARSALSQFVTYNRQFSVGSWITTNELSMIAGLPQKEVVGLSLKEEVEFGLNMNTKIEESSRIHLGQLVQSGHIMKQIPVHLDKRHLDKHMFITGVTGSGKTTTCQKILMASELPFLIIEPAKTEYRILTQTYADMIVFTLGKDFVTPFRLNPFEFFRHESITSRVDMIKASIEASFDMEAAIPQLIETAIYACYEDYGWNIMSNTNDRYDDPFADGVYAFPTLGDLINKVDVVVNEQGFDERLKNDYIGSIKARLRGLLVGSKGMMLNTPRSINFEDLLERRVVLELEEIRSASEKSLIMGFVLTNLMEAIKARYLKNGTFRHITLIEEAHRLLSKFSEGDSPNKKQGVETFTDMLAEIRKYGESLMIVDQIANKLTPEVLKNTNTKIVHKIFAQDDKEAIGNTIVLDKEQKEFLSNLEVGRAIVFTQGFHKAVQVQIEQLTNTTSEEMIDEAKLQEIVYAYYAKHYKSGVIPYCDFLEEEPTVEEIRDLIKLSRDIKLIKLVKELWEEKPTIKAVSTLIKLSEDTKLKKIIPIFLEKQLEPVQFNKEYKSSIEKYIEIININGLAYYLLSHYYDKENKGEPCDESICGMSDILQACLNEEVLSGTRRNYISDGLIDNK